MHAAIDKYKDYCDAGLSRSAKAGQQLLPETLEHTGGGREACNSPEGKKMRFLRRIPADPFTGKHGMGHAQRPGRSEVHELGRAECI